MKLAVALLIAAVAVNSIDAVSFENIGIVVNKDDFGSGSWDFDWSGSGSGTYSCDEVCPTDYEPLCGSDGVTYTNDCALSVAKCKATDLIVASKGKCALASSTGDDSTTSSTATACPGACLDVYDPVSDENGVTYSNKCYMQMAKCKGEKNLLAKSTKATKSPREEASTKSSKSTKTGNVQSSVGTLFEDGSSGVLDSGSASGTAECSGACPDIYSPVCGSDGVTYSNPCKLEAASCKNPKLKIHEASDDNCAGSASTTSQQATVGDKKTTKTTKAVETD